MTGRRPQPVLGAVQASAAATALTGLLVTGLARHGWLLPDALTGPITDLIEVGIVAAVGAAGTLWAGLWARARVTPVADPRDDDGSPLVVDDFDDVLVEPADAQPPPTELMPAVLPPVPTALKPTPIGDALADTLPVEVIRG